MRLSGTGGDVKVGGRLAASLAAWRLNGTLAGEDGWTVASTTTGPRDAFWLEGTGPFDLTLRLGARCWTWRGVSLSLTGGDTVEITGRGEAEVSHAQ